MSWAIADALVARLPRSVPLPDGRMLRTLRDAGEYIQELPRATHQRPEWQIQILLEAVRADVFWPAPNDLGRVNLPVFVTWLDQFEARNHWEISRF